MRCREQTHSNFNPDVSILVVAYNSREHIRACLDAVFDASPKFAIEVLLIDNGVDGTEDLVRQYYPATIIAESRGNIGFGRANNVLAKIARAPLLLLLNPDMVINGDTIDQLVEASRRAPDAAAWGGITLSPQGRPDDGNNLRILKLRHLLRRLIFCAGDTSSPATLSSHELMQVDVISGGLALINRKFWDGAKGFDESFFLYSEETDLFCRAKQEGWTLWRTPMATAVHNVGSGDCLSKSRMLYMATGQMQFMRKHWSMPKTWLGGAIMWGIAIERYLIGHLLGWRNPYIRRVGQAHSLVATRPWEWLRGYDGRRWRSVRAS